MTPHWKEPNKFALPLEATHKAAAREKSIRHGHSGTMHLWSARRLLAACRAAPFASLVDDPGGEPARLRSPGPHAGRPFERKTAYQAARLDIDLSALPAVAEAPA